ncbi:MAG: hypothetical protein EXR74_03200 [Bdellovibrionales bacterium]|nr:hypothetical protein [Bdellovibrionales bacterium]
MKIFTLALLLVSSMLTASPISTTFNKDLQIYESVEKVSAPNNLEVILEKTVLYRGDVIETTVIFDQLVNLGKKVWALIESNKPVVNVNYLYANALPKGVRNSEDLDNFSDLQSTSYRMQGTNLYGITVYDLTYSLVHRFGGSYDGRGKYLENVTVIPTNVEVLWGYTLSYDVEKVSVVNSGTRENPIASILLGTNFKVSTVIKSSENHSLYEFRGDRSAVRAIQN